MKWLQRVKPKANAKLGASETAVLVCEGADNFVSVSTWCILTQPKWGPMTFGMDVRQEGQKQPPNQHMNK